MYTKCFWIMGNFYFFYIFLHFHLFYNMPILFLGVSLVNFLHEINTHAPSLKPDGARCYKGHRSYRAALSLPHPQVCGIDPPNPSRKLRPESPDSHGVRSTGCGSEFMWSHRPLLHPTFVLAQSSSSPHSRRLAWAETVRVLQAILAKVRGIKMAQAGSEFWLYHLQLGDPGQRT